MKHRVLAVIAIGFAFSGCTRKAEGQTVAVVNGEEITVPDLNFALNSAKVPEGMDKTAARSQVLQQLVDRRLLVEQARKEGIDKTPDFVNRERRADEDLLISLLAARRLNTTQLPSDREVQAFIASHPGVFANREIWTLDQVLYTAPTDKDVLADVVKAHDLGAVVTVLQQHNIRFTRQSNHLDTAIVPPELYNRISALPAGEPFVVPVGNRSVASAIISREPRPVAGDQAKPAAVAMMRKSETAKSLEGLLKSLRGSAKIDYQPGYAPPKIS